MESLIRSMPLPGFMMMVGFLLVVAGIFVYAGLQAKRRAKLLESMPTSNIGMANDGYCELEGRVEAIDGQPLRAPLTHTPCVWFEAKVEKFVRSSGKKTANWRTVRDLTSSAPFLLLDQTGTCTVHPFGAEVKETDKSMWYGSAIEPDDRNPARVGPEVSLPGAVEISGTPNTKFRYFERRIYDGDPLLVLGEFNRGRRRADRFGADADEDEDRAESEESEELDELAEDEAGGHEVAGESESGGGVWDTSLEDRLSDRADEVTSACIARGSGAKPFIVSTTLQAVDVAQSEMGGQAALSLAAAPLLAAAFLLWVRYG